MGEGDALLTLFFGAYLLSKTLAVGTESSVDCTYLGWIVTLLSWAIPTHTSPFNVAEADFWGAGQLAPN